MPLLVLQHCPVTPIGLVGDPAVKRGAELATLFLDDGDRVPKTMGDFDGLTVLRGRVHTGDDVRYPAFAPILSLIRECGAANVPTLGLCLGAQLIARAFGQRVYRFGSLATAGRNDPLFQGLDPKQQVMQMHEDSFDLPQEAVLLMRNDSCENQPVRIGTSICGIHAHPEVTRKDARNFPRDFWAAMTRHYGDQAEAVERQVLSEVDAYFEEGAPFRRTVTDRCLNLVVSGCSKPSKDCQEIAQAR